ncbi:MAG: hypothetical protein Ct9H90mP4_12400 [Gammaproteobacteria bacterium]|nr:MAG: hypothetical protein Ct9H90mP4_12400 [Gammaproteobacteria bacterium]
MYEYLIKIDPKSASNIHPNDSQRIKRAIEVYRLTKKPKFSLAPRKLYRGA